jgi:predicted O-methyltransferase YrrM
VGGLFKNMNITDRLTSLDPTLIVHNEGEWSNSFSKYSAFNDAGVECEVGEFLYSMVRVLKPTSVLETGTHVGVGASYMGLAVKDNGFGHLDTIEFLPELHVQANHRINKIGLSQVVTCHFMDVKDFQPEFFYQFMFLDTEPQTRFAEFVRFYDFLDDGGYCFIHDLHNHMHQIPNEEHGFAWPYGPVPGFMKQLVRSGEIRPIHFETPRGLTGFYKVRESDYKWKGGDDNASS